MIATWSVHCSHVISAWAVTWSVYDQPGDQTSVYSSFLQPLSLQFMSTQECCFQLHTKLLATCTRMFFKDSSRRHFLVVLWLGFHTSTARGLSLIPCQGTMTLQAAPPERKNEILTSKTNFIPEPCLLFCLYKQIAPHPSSCKALKPMNHHPWFPQTYPSPVPLIFWFHSSLPSATTLRPTVISSHLTSFPAYSFLNQ